MERMFSMVDEKENMLVQHGDLGGVKFARALNPHSGFFVLSAEQFDTMSRQQHFLDMDCSFISPLESAATLCLLKNFSVFKPRSEKESVVTAMLNDLVPWGEAFEGLRQRQTKV